MARFLLYRVLRDSLSPSAKEVVRRAADLLLAPVGSVGGARSVDPVLALTFDDGPDPVTTSRVLDVLATHRVRATFFVLVERVERHPQIAQRILAEGHEVGLHGIDHTALTSLPLAQVRLRLAEGRSRLEQVVGCPVHWFRPPYGAQSLRTYLQARRAGMEVVVWDADAHDWIDTDAAKAADRALEHARPGGVILLHDAKGDEASNRSGGPQLDRAEVVDRLLDGLECRGLRATTVGSLLAGRRARRAAWFRPPGAAGVPEPQTGGGEGV